MTPYERGNHSSRNAPGVTLCISVGIEGVTGAANLIDTVQLCAAETEGADRLPRVRRGWIRQGVLRRFVARDGEKNFSWQFVVCRRVPMLGEKAGVRVPCAEGIGRNDRTQLWQVGHDAVNPVADERLSHLGDCFIACRAVRDHFREQRVVIRGDCHAFVERAINSQPRHIGLHEPRDRARLR